MIELQAFVGHLLVVGGRAVRVPPPGALAETAPKRASRAREGDTFFILITPAGTSHAPAAFYQELAQLASDVYFGSGGTITSGLREALSAIQGQLAETPDDHHDVNGLAMVLRGEELYAARSGQMFGVLRQGDALASFPTQRSDPLAALPPLSAESNPEIQLAHFAVAPGQIMLLADTSLIAVPDEALLDTLGGDSIPTVIDRLKPLAGSETSATIIQFAVSGTPDPTRLTPQPNLRTSRPVERASRPPVIPAPVPTTAPVTALPSAPVIPHAPPEPAPVPPAEKLPPVLLTFEDEPVPPVTNPFEPEVVEAAIPVADEEPPAEERPQTPATPGRWSELTGGVGRLRLTVRRTLRDLARLVLTGILGVIDFFTRLLDRVLPAPAEGGKQGISTNLAISMAVLIPVLIVVVVLGLVLSGYDRSDFETYLDRAQSTHDEAIKLANGNCSNLNLRSLWVETQRLAEMAARYRPNDPNVLVIQADAQNYLDCYDVVQRRDITLLQEFPKDSDLVGPVVHDGIDLYILDRQTGAVYHDTLNQAGDGLTARDENPIVQRNQAVGIYTVGDLFDIEWLRSGGTAHDNVLIALDTDGVLVSYSPTFFASAQQLIIADRWITPTSIAIFRSNLYVLDTGANQIWRYVPPAGESAYSTAPEEYFNSGVLPDLSEAVDFGIGEDGAIYILFKDGITRKYRRNVQGIAEELPFNYNNNPAGALASGAGLFVYNDPAASSLLILDEQNQAVYETSWAGRYQNGYRPRNLPTAFRDFRGVYADAVVRNNVYVIAGNKLYQFRRN